MKRGERGGPTESNTIAAWVPGFFVDFWLNKNCENYLFVGLEHGVPERHVMDKSLDLALHAPVPATPIYS
jgi:hypothetical protein